MMPRSRSDITTLIPDPRTGPSLAAAQRQPLDPEERLAQQARLVADAAPDHERLGAVVGHERRPRAGLRHVVGQADAVEVDDVDAVREPAADGAAGLGGLEQRHRERPGSRDAGGGPAGHRRRPRGRGDVDDLDRAAVTEQFLAGACGLGPGMRPALRLQRDEVDVMPRRDAGHQVVAALKAAALGRIGYEMGQPQHTQPRHVRRRAPDGADARGSRARPSRQTIGLRVGDPAVVATG